MENRSVYTDIIGDIQIKTANITRKPIARIAQIQRLRQDLGVNLVGAAIVLDLAQEVAQLRAQIEIYRSGLQVNSR